MTLIVFRSSGNSIFDKCILSDVTVTIVTILFLLNNYVVSSHLDYASTFCFSLVSPSHTPLHTSFHTLICSSNLILKSTANWLKFEKGFRILDTEKYNIHFSWEAQKRCKKPWKRCSWKAHGACMYRPASYPHPVWVFNSVSTSEKI